jgi:uncharacterized protein YndB with AHSA1/START domain
MSQEIQPVVKLQMLFRVPVEQAFEAFVDPEMTTRFWFTHSSGPLEVGREVVWEWRMYGVSTRVYVLELVKNRRIVMDWGDEGKRSTVEWNFQSRPDGFTSVEISNFGFIGTADEVVREAIDSSSGFSLVLANAKSLLEYGIDLNLIRDRSADAHVSTTDPPPPT